MSSSTQQKKQQTQVKKEPAEKYLTDPAAMEFGMQYSIPTQKLLVSDQGLREALEIPARDATTYFGLRYGSFGGPGVMPLRETPRDILDVALYLYKHEGSDANLKHAVEVLEKKNLLVSQGAKRYGSYIRSPLFYLLTWSWRLSTLLYPVAAILGYYYYHYFGALNSLILVRTVMDFLTMTYQNQVILGLVWIVLYGIDWACSLRYDQYVGYVSVIPLGVRWGLILLVTLFGDVKIEAPLVTYPHRRRPK